MRYASVPSLDGAEHRLVEFEPHRTYGVELAEGLGLRVAERKAVAARKVVHVLSVARAADEHVDHGESTAGISTATPSTASLMRCRKETTAADSSGVISMTAASIRPCMLPSV